MLPYCPISHLFSTVTFPSFTPISVFSLISGNVSNRFMVDFGGQSLDEELPLGRYSGATDKIQMLTDMDFYGDSYSIFSVNVFKVSRYK